MSYKWELKIYFENGNFRSTRYKFYITAFINAKKWFKKDKEINTIVISRTFNKGE